MKEKHGQGMKGILGTTAHSGMTPMDLAFMQGKTEAAEWLRTNSGGGER